jgi:GTP-binding protein HflX
LGIFLKNQSKGSRKVCEESLEELAFLTRSAGVLVSDSFLVSREEIDGATYIGSGKSEEILGFVREHKITLLIVDDHLSPAQLTNMNKNFGVTILDRIELILNIFAKRAHTAEAQVQVELAQLKYLLPRLTRMWTHLSRQAGGGVWMKGPGETQLEIDRRRVRERIHRLTQKLEGVRQTRQLQRKNRSKKDFVNFSLVGYTHAGKSSLFNRLTDSHTDVLHKLFSTLDPLSRQLELSPCLSVILTDTVGFIRNLPNFLVESFKATLEEVVEADCLLHVVDGSTLDLDAKMEAVQAVLKELHVEDKPFITIINKIDLLSEMDLRRLEHLFQGALFISTKTGEGIEKLVKEMLLFLRGRTQRKVFFLPVQKMGLVKKLFSGAEMLEEKYEENGVTVMADVNPEVFERVKNYEIPSCLP